MSSTSGETPRQQRRGSSMSDRQIVGAALRGRQVTFRFLKTQIPHETRGFVVGKDDYHWLIATSPAPKTEGVNDTSEVSIMLVHKSAADLIVIDTRETLSTLPEQYRKQINKIGEPFWATQTH